MAQRIALDDFDKVFGSLIELSSEALGGSIVSVSDEFFASASCLLRVPPSVSMKGQFGPNGALFDGWESRRHNPDHDWCIIKLGALGSIAGFDVDTGHFNGNESPASGVWGAHLEQGASITHDSPKWQTLLPITPLGPAQRHLFLLPSASKPVTHLKLTMHPDGGLGRFRAYGNVVPPPFDGSSKLVDLAYVLNGATVTGESDQHFGRGGNLILPGRGKDMGDGWETKRSRGRLGTGKGDWVVIKLGEPGYLEWADIDTNHFVGNFPESAELHGITSDEDLPAQEAEWIKILDRTKLGPHRQHFFQLQHPEKAWTHVRLSIYPDGGVKRVRLYGRAAKHFPNFSSLVPLSQPALAGEGVAKQVNGNGVHHNTADSSKAALRCVALPLTPDAFSPYGSVIQSYPDQRSARKNVVIKRVNFGTASKFNHLAPVKFIQPPNRPELKGEINFCVFRCDPQNGAQVGGRSSSGQTTRWHVDVLERHEFSSQAFIPMPRPSSSVTRTLGTQQQRQQYLVIVALPDATSGQPDLSTLRAFMADDAQGISYHPNIWHHPLIALDGVTDFACIVHETGVDEIDCEIKHFDGTVAVVDLP